METNTTHAEAPTPLKQTHTNTLTPTQKLSKTKQNRTGSNEGNNSSGQLKFFHNISIEKQDKQQPKPIQTNTQNEEMEQVNS